VPQAAFIHLKSLAGILHEAQMTPESQWQNLPSGPLQRLCPILAQCPRFTQHFVRAAAFQDLARRIEQPREEIDLTSEEGSVSLIGENNHITQLRVVIAQLCRKLRESSNWSTPQHTTLELQFQTLTGTIVYMKEQEASLKARQEQIDLLRAENMAFHGLRYITSCDSIWG